MKNTTRYLSPLVILLTTAVLAGTGYAQEKIEAEQKGGQPKLGGTYLSATGMLPPLPYHPYPDLPTVDLGKNQFAYDDTKVDYAALRAEATKFAAQNASLQGEGGGGPAMMCLSEGLRLTPPVDDGTNFNLTILGAEPFGKYDLFMSTNFPGTNAWSLVGRTAPDQTELSILPPPGGVLVFMLGTMQDSDGDGLTDAYEQLVAHTSVQQPNNPSATNLVLIPLLTNWPRGIRVHDYSGVFTRTETWNPCTGPVGATLSQVAPIRWNPDQGGEQYTTNVFTYCAEGTNVIKGTNYYHLAWAPNGEPRMRVRQPEDADWSPWETNIFHFTTLPSAPAGPYWTNQVGRELIDVGGGAHSDVSISWRHTVDLCTGFTNPPRTRLYGVHAVALAHTALIWGSALDTPFLVPGTNITLLGRRCNTNGLVWRALPDNNVVDATPRLDPQYTNYLFNVEASWAELKLYVNGSDYTDGEVTVEAGQQIHLRCALEPDIATITNYQWTIPNEPISNWVHTATLGEVIQLPLSAYTNSAVTNYWWKRATNFVVECSIMVEGEPMTAKTTVTVRKPFATITASNASVIEASSTYDNTGNPSLHFGRFPGVPGIRISRSPSALTGWTWCQLITTERKQRDATTQAWITQSGSGLDLYPYPEAELYTIRDSPGFHFQANKDQATLLDGFWTYLMHDPGIGASIPVPVARISWSWAAQAHVVNGVWTLQTSPNAFNIDQQNVEDVWPEWNGNFEDWPWQ